MGSIRSNRTGPSRRTGADVGFADVRARFDFQSIRIGRWVTRDEQARAAGLFFDALIDLMTALRVPETVISLRGTLGLHYGCGGRPGVAAHYDPRQRIFALAKNAGPGSIAHEWFHAFDHYIAGRAFVDSAPVEFASRAWLLDRAEVGHPLNARLFACFHEILLDESGVQPSELMRASLAADKRLEMTYYSQPEEVCARAFEAFVQDLVVNNRFLVKGTRQSQEAQKGLYPRGEQRQRIAAAFADYFSTLGQALRSVTATANDG